MENTKEIKLSSTYKTSPNIAVIKYWGKLEESLIIPLNSSLGFTLNTDDLCTITTVKISTKNTKDILILNGKEFSINDRLERILHRFRKEHLSQLIEKLKKENESDPEYQQINQENFQYFYIESVNDFPTASGLASSASGLAAISVCLCDIFGIPEKLSEIARLGSGSACRSVYGGLVEWKGPDQSIIQNFYQNQKKSNCFDIKQLTQLSQLCTSKQIYSTKSQFFNKIKILIFCASFSAKEVPSTGGMKQTVQTSDLLEFRVKQGVQNNIIDIKQALEQENYNKFAEITIKDSNQFHSVCLDTQPPIFYLNEFSKFLISIVEKLNMILPQKIAYTFDAGPHGVLFIHEESFDLAFESFKKIFDFKQDVLNKKGQNTLAKHQQKETEFQYLLEKNAQIKEIIQFFKEKLTQGPSYVIQTDVGPGPIKI